jgi:hypothetical protein
MDVPSLRAYVQPLALKRQVDVSDPAIRDRQLENTAFNNNTAGYLKLKMLNILRLRFQTSPHSVCHGFLSLSKTLDGTQLVVFLLQQKLQSIHLQKGVNIPLMTGHCLSYLLSEFCHRKVITFPSEIHHVFYIHVTVRRDKFPYNKTN